MRYVQIFDVRSTRLWGNVSAMMVYMYLTMTADYRTNEVRQSLRQIARESRTTLSAVRYALKIMQELDLCEVTPCCVHMLNPNRATEFVNASRLREREHELKRLLNLTQPQFDCYLAIFTEMQEMRGTTWKTLDGLQNHFINWALKPSSQQLFRTRWKQEPAQPSTGPVDGPAQSSMGPVDGPAQQVTEDEQKWIDIVTDLRCRSAEGDDEATRTLASDKVMQAIRYLERKKLIS